MVIRIHQANTPLILLNLGPHTTEPAQDHSHGHMYTNTCTSIYTRILHPSESPLGKFCLTQIFSIKIQTSLITNILLGLLVESLYFTTSSFFVECSLHLHLSQQKQFIFHFNRSPTSHCSQDISLSLYFVFNGGCSFFQLLLPLTLQVECMLWHKFLQTS